PLSSKPNNLSMDSSRGPASFFTQANALLRKNLCFQARTASFTPPVCFCLFVYLSVSLVDFSGGYTFVCEICF
ncbi:hypothetical protein, partial [Klebsiella pneumoniae]|uniref:hypothetical protein n=1 Tax=Klebsiella pneumoniae TaxID=573 RepID=UPI00301410E8